MNSERPHLIPALAAIFVFFGGVVVAHFYAINMEEKYVHILSAQMNLESMNGSILQRIGIRQPDLLLVYGSSEMINMDTENRSVNFFKDYPTGFQVYEIAMGGVTCLNITQDLAALGSDLAGKKVVISFTPVMFDNDMVHPDAYWGSYSNLHANETGFSLLLSMDLKRKIATRMLDYPDTLEKDPFLSFSLQQLKANTPLNDLVYYLTIPLGQINLQVLHLQDHWQVLNFIWSHPEIKPGVKHHPKNIDWQKEMDDALIQQINNANNNPYGVDNDTWAENYSGFTPLSQGSFDERFKKDLQASKEWGDLEIVMQTLKEMGASPLIMSRPINGYFFIANGISSDAQAVYYSTLEQAVKAYNMPLEDFKEFTMNKYFNTDKVSHTSRLGWIYVNQVFDKFFHDSYK